MWGHNLQFFFVLVCFFFFFFVCPLSAAAGTGVPTQWQVSTLDTLRLSRFAFRKLSVKAHPPLASKEELHRLTGRVVERVGFVLGFLTSRYEDYTGPSVTLTTTVPIAQIAEAIEGERDADVADMLRRHPAAGGAAQTAAQASPEVVLPPWIEARRGDIAELDRAAHQRFVASRAIPELRDVIEALFQIRSELDPPVIAIHNPWVTRE
jgi:hypothetical protein